MKAYRSMVLVSSDPKSIEKGANLVFEKLQVYKQQKTSCGYKQLAHHFHLFYKHKTNIIS